MGQKKGYKQSPEHIAARIKRGKDHPRWKGDSITEKSGRSRALRLFPIIGPCKSCGSPRSERHHKNGNTRDNRRSNIIPLCRSCHMKIGHPENMERFRESAKRRIKATTEAAAIEKRSRTICKRGHQLSGDNLYVHPSGRRVCIECRKLHKRNYRERKSSADHQSTHH